MWDGRTEWGDNSKEWHVCIRVHVNVFVHFQDRNAVFNVLKRKEQTHFSSA